jgi:LacI family transcriptional regulator
MEAGHRQKVTVTDVAARAGVDRSVVSRVLSNDPRLSIRPETRQRVLDAVSALAYRPNAVARSLRTAQAGAYALIIPAFTNPVWAEVISGAQRAAATHHSLLFSASTSAGRLDAAPIVALLAPGRVDGVLIADVLITEPTMQRLRDLQIPWLALNMRVPAKRSIILDDERAGRIATRHLLDLKHRRIGFIADAARDDSAERRSIGYRAALSEAGLAPNPALVAESDGTDAGGARAMIALLERPERPTAVFAFNVASAIGALHSANARGVRIPADLSIVSVHDLAITPYLNPALTTVRMPLEQLGARGIDLLRMAAGDAEVNECIAEPIELVVRASTAPPPD